MGILIYLTWTIIRVSPKEIIFFSGETFSIISLWDVHYKEMSILRKFLWRNPNYNPKLDAINT